MDTYAGERRRIAIEHLQAQSHRNVLEMGEKDTEARKRQQGKLANIAADPELARDFLLRASMIASLHNVPTAH